MAALVSHSIDKPEGNVSASERPDVRPATTDDSPMLTAKSCLSGFDYGAAMLDDEGRAEPLRVALVVVTNFGYVLVILILREVSHCIADPFSAYRNGINAEKYLDLLVAGTSKLIKDNKALPVDGKQVRGGS